MVVKYVVIMDFNLTVWQILTKPLNLIPPVTHILTFVHEALAHVLDSCQVKTRQTKAPPILTMCVIYFIV